METKADTLSDIMNLVGYGLAKFDLAFVNEFGFKTKSSFYRFIVDIGFANTQKAVSNRQDSFDPYFNNGRRGWFQRNQREHIKLYIDSLFGEVDVHDFANIVKFNIHEYNSNIVLQSVSISPIVKTKFRQLQETGKEAEFYFINNFRKIKLFERGLLEDARLWGDGYDFQIQVDKHFYLTEVKGVRDKMGSIRMTQCEYEKARDLLSDYFLIVVSNLSSSPKLNIVENPFSRLPFTMRNFSMQQCNYYSEIINWQLYEN